MDFRTASSVKLLVLYCLEFILFSFPCTKFISRDQLGDRLDALFFLPRIPQLLTCQQILDDICTWYVSPIRAPYRHLVFVLEFRFRQLEISKGHIVLIVNNIRWKRLFKQFVHIQTLIPLVSLWPIDDTVFTFVWKLTIQEWIKTKCFSPNTTMLCWI